MLAGSPTEDRKRGRDDESNSAFTVEPCDEPLPQNKHLCAHKKNGFNGIFRSLNLWSSNGNNSNNNESTLECRDSEVPLSPTHTDSVSGKLFYGCINYLTSATLSERIRFMLKQWRMMRIRGLSDKLH